MLGEALYYPHIDIDDPKWLRSAILFWDSLQTIVPLAVEQPYKNKDTKILWQEGFLKPLRCDLHPDLLDTLGRRVIALMNQDGLEFINRISQVNDQNDTTLMHVRKIGWDLREFLDRAGLHPEKLSPELRGLVMRAGVARMHPGKMPPSLRRLLSDLQYISMYREPFPVHFRHLLSDLEHFSENNDDWLFVDSGFAEIYMSALAALLAKETDLAALTNRDVSLGINLHTLVEDVKPSAQSDKKGALVSFIMETIRVDPEVRIETLLSFRRSRIDQLAELSAQFDDLSSKISDSESAQEMKEKVGDAYITRIRPKLESLKDELKDNSIQSVWEGVHRAITISVPASSALAYFTGFSGTTLLATGAAVAITDVAIKAHLARKKTRRASPYTYLLDVRKNFHQEIIIP
jgi:hypothetical protein